MSKRIILLTIVSGLIIVAIAVGVGLYTYTNIQSDKSYENAQKELNRYITMNDWYAYEFHNREESIVCFY
jgi:peptidoglycan hydrolase CwlO-like protein